MSRLQINHPLPGGTVFSNFLVAQGEGDPAIRNIIGIIWDPSGMVVAVGMALQNPPHWAITFTDFKPGSGYCLEVIDANTRQRLACAGPFDAVLKHPAHGPSVYFPTLNGSLDRNGWAYGYTPGINAVEGSVTGPAGASPWFFQSQGPPATRYWAVPFSGLTPDPTHMSTLTVREKVNPASATSVTGLAIT